MVHTAWIVVLEIVETGVLLWRHQDADPITRRTRPGLDVVCIARNKRGCSEIVVNAGLVVVCHALSSRSGQFSELNGAITTQPVV